MRHVLITHADEPLGRRAVKTLYHDDQVDHILAVGHGPPPRAFDHFLAGSRPRFEYARVDLAKHRPVSDLFRSGAFRRAEIDTVIYVPRHGPAAAAFAPLPAGLAERTAETRLLLQQCLEAGTVRSLIALGSAYVYKLPPGNANRLTEESELDLDPGIPEEIRSWIDSDMILHGEVHNDRLRVVLLRVPAVVESGGYVYFHPTLSSPARQPVRTLGFDPLCALVSGKDVTRALRCAVHSSHSGIYNIAGHQSLPLSVLARWTGPSLMPVPGPLLSMARTGWRLLNTGAPPVHAPHLRYGFTLDTRRAERELGFTPSDHIGLSRAGDGEMQLETTSL